MRPDWGERIVELVLVKQQIHSVDTSGLWEYRLPRVAATEAQIQDAETRLGEPLPGPYRSFLARADGWPAFFQTVDLFGTDDLGASARFQQAVEATGYVDDSVYERIGCTRADLVPIAASAVDLDLFVMLRRHTSAPGAVVWIAGSEVDRFPHFDEYFAAMVDYNRREFTALGGGPVKHTP